jgi:hypothetical protein
MRMMTMTEKQKWSYLWRYIFERMLITEPAAKHAASLAMSWLEKHK